MGAAAAIEVDGVSVAYGERVVLEGIDLQLAMGQIVGLIGPNGAGKTTLLQAIMGAVPLAHGQIRVLGEPIARVRTRVAYVPQREHVDWQFPIDVLHVVLMGRYGRLGLGRRPGPRDRQVARAALDHVGMLRREHCQIGELSGGQQQRVFLARALAQEAEVLLLDEPFTGIDATTQELIFKVLAEHRARGGTVLLSTHDLHAIEQRCDRLIALNRRLVAFGHAHDVFTPGVLVQTFGSHATTLQVGSTAVVIQN